VATTRTQRKAGRMAAKATPKAAKATPKAAKAGGKAAKAGAKIAAGPLGAKAAMGGAKMTAYLTSGAAAQKAREVATQVVPVSQRAGETAAQSIREAREWAAPRLDDAADAVTDTVAPRVAAALKATARHLEPRPRRTWVARTLTDWRAVLGAAGIVTAAGAAAAVMRRRNGSLVKPVSSGQQQSDGSPSAGSGTPANLSSQ
jgi:hypothetical protein